MNAAEWIVIDTETTGLEAPIFVIEVHAQRMLGWQTLGEPFTAYLNHKVPVPADAVAVHGITAEFLESHGLDPHEVHTSLLDYIGSRPVTAHNLNYDWDRCLIPEWSRLGLQLSVQARKGFCSMLLGRRILPETRSVALQTLANLYGMTRDKLHSASGDVAITIQLLTTIYRERLERAGVGTYQEVEKFSRQTPVRDCHQRIFGDAVPAFLTSPIVLTSLSANNVSGTQAAFREGCSLVPMDQRSPEWIRWHHSGIGSSDASVIMGVDPWRTPVAVTQK